MPTDLPNPNLVALNELQQTVDRLRQEVKRLRSQHRTLLASEPHKQNGNHADLNSQLNGQQIDLTCIEPQIQFQLKLLDAVAQAVIATDLEGKILYWNRYAETLYGWSAAEVLGRSVLDIVPANVTCTQAHEIMTHLQRGEQWSAEFLVQHKDGTTFMAWVSDSPIYDDQGKLIGIVGVSFDVSDRKRREAEYHQTSSELETAYIQLEQSYHDLAVTNTELTITLQELQTAENQLLEKTQALDRAHQQTRHERQRYQDLFNLAPDGYLITDMEGVIQEANQAAIALLCPHQGPEYLIRLPLRIFVSRQHLSFFRTCLYQLKQANLVQSFELKLQVSQNKQVFPVAVTTSRILNESGQPTGLRWLIRDITLLKQAEQALQQANRKLESRVKARTADLRQAERRWRTLLEDVHLAVVGLDRSGNMTYVNPFFLASTDYQAHEILGRDWFSQFVPPSHQSSLRQYFQSLLSQPNPPLQHQAPILTRSGEERIIAWNHTLLWDESNTAIGTMSIGEDITERFAIDRIKAEFIAVVSHELRTPLAAIHGGLQLLTKGIVTSETEQGQTLIQVASENSQRLVRLVNDILALERLESGNSPLHKTSFNTRDLTRQVVDTFQLSTQQVEIALEVSDPGIEIVADCDRIFQVLTNLLDNAIKFSPTNTTLQLTVESLPSDNDNGETTVLFKVCDQGRGIPAEKCETIFDRFVQVDSSDSRQKGGTGLGLSICRNIVEQHNGSIWVESTLGEGSCFHFTLPVH